LSLSESIAGVVPLPRDLATEAVGMVARLGVRNAFGVSGGGIGRVWRALLDEPDIETLHFRNEAGAAFAAIEASLESRAPVAVFSTTGPGITNTLTGMAAARAEGAKVLLISARTSPAQRGRGAVQETPMPSSDFFAPGWLFDEVFLIESSAELAQMEQRLRHGFARIGAYVAHISIPVSLQNTPVGGVGAVRHPYRLSHPSPDPAAVDEVLDRMATDRFAIWVGHGARHSAGQIRALAELTGAPVLATPRGKGIVPEDHPQYVMVTGLGGHPRGIEHLQRHSPDFTLVLGSRLGEPSSGWDSRLIPPGGFVHVDIDASVPGAALDAPVLAIQADVGTFVEQLLHRSERIRHQGFACPSPFPEPLLYRESAAPVRPPALLQAVQREVADAGTPILVEPGSAMAWAAHLLRLSNPGQLRSVGSFGSMGQMACGVIGTALARGGPAVCLTGDGSMLMNNEINTAVEYDIPAIWVVLNNSRYQMCEMGMRFNPSELHARFRECDFVRVARGMGARATSVKRESDLEPALRRAVAEGGPFLIDVKVDPEATPPFESRFKSLK
jgi:acetolactate synthase I/II/III large subunit